MSSETSSSENNSTSYKSKMENILPPSISKMERSLPNVPKMERSFAMVDSFMSERSHSQPGSPPASDIDHSRTSTPTSNGEPFTPLTNWAHLSLIKNQRNTLRSELKAQQIAGAQARASVATLRRMAFRLAVKISVKEKHIADVTKSLARSRKTNDVVSRSAEEKIQTLKESLLEEERKNQVILETLEKASMLTLQCMCLPSR
jgi:hypothetical protein